MMALCLYASAPQAWAQEECDALRAELIAAVDKHNRCVEPKDCSPMFFYQSYECAPDPLHPPYVHAKADMKALSAVFEKFAKACLAKGPQLNCKPGALPPAECVEGRCVLPASR